MTNSTGSEATERFQLFPGTFANNINEFAEQFQELTGRNHAQHLIKALYDESCGHLPIAVSVANKLHRLIGDDNYVTHQDFSTLVAPEILEITSASTEQARLLAFAREIAHLTIINDYTLTIASRNLHTRWGAGEFFSPSTELALNSLLSKGYLHISHSRFSCQYRFTETIKGVLQAITSNQLHASSSLIHEHFTDELYRDALVAKLNDSTNMSELLPQCVKSRSWSMLRHLWASKAHTLFSISPNETIAAYQAVPDTVRENVPTLLEAFNATAELQVASVKNNISPENALNHARFTFATLPALPSYPEGFAGEDLTSDDIAIIAMKRMHDFRVKWNVSSAMKIGEEAAADLETREHLLHDSLTRLTRSRFRMEHAMVNLADGNAPVAIKMLQSAAEHGKSDLTASPYFLSSVYAYSSLAHALIGRGLDADAELDRHHKTLTQLTWPACEAVAAANIGRAIRSLDVLNFDRAAKLLDDLNQYDIGNSMIFFREVCTDIAAVLQGKAGARMAEHINIAFAETVRYPENAQGLYSAGYAAGVLTLSSKMLHANWCMPVARNIGRSSAGELLAQAHAEQAHGRYSSGEKLSRIVAASSAATIRAKATAQGIVVASLIRQGRVSEAKDASHSMMKMCKYANTILPIALMPNRERNLFMSWTKQSVHWDLLASDASLLEQLSPKSLQLRLESLGETVPGVVPRLDVTQDDLILLKHLMSDRSLAEIANSMGYVEGTLKNRASRLYRKFGVNSRQHAIELARDRGLLAAYSPYEFRSQSGS